jgi:hypothetical protein
MSSHDGPASPAKVHFGAEAASTLERIRRVLAPFR